MKEFKTKWILAFALTMSLCAILSPDWFIFGLATFWSSAGWAEVWSRFDEWTEEEARKKQAR